MTESLKTIRFTNRLLLGASAAILAFYLAPTRDKLYSSALDNLDSLREFVTRRPGEARDESPLSPAWELLDVAEKINESVIGGYEHEFEVQDDLKILDATAFEKLAMAGADEDVDKLFLTLRTAAKQAEHDDIYFYDRDAIQSIVKQFHDEYFDRRTSDGILVDELPEEEREEVLDAGDVWDRIRLEVETPGKAVLSAISRSFYDESSQVLGSVRGTAGDTTALTDFLKRHGMIDESGDPLPALAGFLLDVRGADIETSIASLLQQRQLDKTSVDIAGVQVRSSTLAVLGPSVVCVLMFYYLVHLQNLRLSLETDHESLGDKGVWMGLFLRPLATAAVHISTWLPVAACVVAVTTAWQVRDWTLTTGIAFTGGTALFAILVTYQIVALHRYLVRTPDVAPRA